MRTKPASGVSPSDLSKLIADAHELEDAIQRDGVILEGNDFDGTTIAQHLADLSALLTRVVAIVCTLAEDQIR